MERRFIEYISSFTTLSKEEEELMLESYPIKQFRKGDCVLEEGTITQDTFLILEGCIRRHCTVDGVDKTTGFFTEGEAVAEFESLSFNKPTTHSYSCVEDTVAVVVNSEKEKAFYKRFPRFEELARMETEKMLGKNQEQLSNFITKSPEERYKHLLTNKPELLQRVPQHQIASYLGVTPESLSRIRKRISKK
ncbi:MAG: Crp/Fnr family transcriptional regulator [Bacteroidia bacterium]|nr:Crp/Fnr family transcriptional regulator [Bacteroidia bacterium]